MHFDMKQNREVTLRYIGNLEVYKETRKNTSRPQDIFKNEAVNIETIKN